MPDRCGEGPVLRTAAARSAPVPACRFPPAAIAARVAPLPRLPGASGLSQPFASRSVWMFATSASACFNSSVLIWRSISSFRRSLRSDRSSLARRSASRWSATRRSPARRARASVRARSDCCAMSAAAEMQRMHECRNADRRRRGAVAELDPHSCILAFLHFCIMWTGEAVKTASVRQYLKVSARRSISAPSARYR